MVQIMNFDNITIPDRIDVRYIQKKYYSKYFCKLIFQIDRSKLVKKNIKQWYNSSYSTYINRFDLINTLIREIKSHIVDDDYRVRAEGNTVSVFTNSETNVAKLVNGLPDQIIELHRPLNTAHVDLVENHKKVLVRNSLFEKKYKFKVYLRVSWEQREARFKEFKEWLESSGSDYDINSILRKYFYTNQGMRGIGYTAAVYFNDPQDLMMFQLRFNDKILNIEEAVLLSEL